MSRAQQYSERASELLDYLSDPAFDDAPNIGAAYDALDTLIDIEEDFLLVSDEVRNLDAYRCHFSMFHIALPFSEGERWYLVEDISLDDARRVDGVDEEALYHEDRIMSEGVRKRIMARTLVNRWLAWRQEADEFKGQGSLDKARISLAYLINNVTPGISLPQSYLDRHGEVL